MTNNHILQHNPKVWGHWDLNPDPRVTPGSLLQLIIISSVDPLENHFHNWSPLGYLITPCPHYFLLALLWRINLLILFFLHFHRICPLFFHTLELLFILTPGVNGKSVNVYNFFPFKISLVYILASYI